MYSSRNGRTWFFICLFVYFFRFFWHLRLICWQRSRTRFRWVRARATRSMNHTDWYASYVHALVSIFFFCFFVFLIYSTKITTRVDPATVLLYSVQAREGEKRKETKKYHESGRNRSMRRPEKLSKYIPNAQTLYIITCKTIFCNGNFFVAALQTDDTILL